MMKYVMALVFLASCGAAQSPDPNDADYANGVKMWLSSIDPNSPTVYTDGYFNMLVGKWLKEPTCTVWRTDRKVSLPPTGISISNIDIEPEGGRLVCRFTLDKLDIKSFGRYAKNYRGGISWPEPPAKRSKLEVISVFMELLFMKEAKP